MIDLSWFKTTGLAAAQTAAHAILGVYAGDALNIFALDYKAALGIAGGAAIASVLGSVVAYKLPDRSTQAVSTAAALVDAKSDSA